MRSIFRRPTVPVSVVTSPLLGLACAFAHKVFLANQFSVAQLREVIRVPLASSRARCTASFTPPCSWRSLCRSSLDQSQQLLECALIKVNALNECENLFFELPLFYGFFTALQVTFLVRGTRRFCSGLARSPPHGSWREISGTRALTSVATAGFCTLPTYFNIGYSITNRSFALVRRADSSRLSPASSALAGIGTVDRSLTGEDVISFSTTVMISRGLSIA